MKRGIILLVMLLVLVPVAFAREQSMKLLSVAEIDGKMEGRTADITLEVKPGQGRVFIDTFPLTRLDTQISTRFAKEIACDYLNRDCSNVDFFYTIKSDAPLLGGPSAGAATALLTITVLENRKPYENVAMTGTINSGGIIGPVGGLREKIDAASTSGIKKVLIPDGETYTDENNVTVDLVEYGKNNGIEIIEVADLDNALYEFTGKVYGKTDEIEPSDVYISTMGDIVDEICENTKTLEMQATTFQYGVNDSDYPLIEQAQNLSIDSAKAYSEGKMYSAASFCFGANIRYYNFFLERRDYDNKTFLKMIDGLENEIDKTSVNLDMKELKTTTDLQTYIIVKERVVEAKENIDLVRDDLQKNDTKSAYYHFAYAKQRLATAYSWSTFFGKDGKKVTVDDRRLQNSCVEKIGEAQERIEYLKFFFPVAASEIDISLDDSFRDMNQGEYALCLFDASKAKAEVDVLIQAMGMTDEGLSEHLQSKLDVTNGVIAEQQSRGIFPILSYSYYEYADVLKEDDPASSMLYSEYALELSNVNMYFGNHGRIILIPDYRVVLYFFLGGLFGYIIARKLIAYREKSKKK